MPHKRRSHEDDDDGTSENHLTSTLDSILEALLLHAKDPDPNWAARELDFAENLLKAIDCDDVSHKKSKSNDSLKTAGMSERPEGDSVGDKKDPIYFRDMKEAFCEILRQFDDDKLENCTVYHGNHEYGYNEDVHQSVAGFRRCLESFGPTRLFRIKVHDERMFFAEDELASVKRREFLKDVRRRFHCGNLPDRIRDKLGSNRSDTYISGLVEMSPPVETDFQVVFNADWTKDAAYIISGESGIGKSTFVQNEFDSKDSVSIYHSLDRNDIFYWNKKIEEPSNKEAMSKIRKIFNELFRQRKTRSRLYSAVSTVHSKLHRLRNGASVMILKSIIEGKVDTYPDLKAWWNGERDPIEKVVLIIDEAGKCESFARGLVDSVREIHKDFIDKRRCKMFKLVLAGSGLDAAIKRDSSFDPVDTAAFGTDPLKSTVVVLKGPKKLFLEDKLTSYFTMRKSRTRIEGFIPKAIAKGAYSRVLATNTRMLFDGIIPILKDEKLTVGIQESGLEQKLHGLCSSKIIMDFAARAYVQLNRLKDLSQDQRQNIISRSFLFLLKSSCDAVQNKHAYPIGTFDSLSVQSMVDLTLMGVVASNPLDTSPALRFLACNGHTDELIPADWISFDGLVAVHLRRFMYASKDCSLVVHTLREAWPGKAIARPRDSIDVSKELTRNFKDYSFDDVRNLTKIILENGPGKLAIIMKQRVPSAQSADIIILEATVEQRKVELCFDLFKAKHCATIPGVKTDTFRDWVKSIGVDMGGSEKDHRHEYSLLGIEYLGNCLKESLCAKFASVDVAIRGRFLVVSKGFKETPWKEDDVTHMKQDYKLTLWTREHLEPTFSAINLDPPTAEDDEAPRFRVEGTEDRSFSSIDKWMKTKE